MMDKTENAYSATLNNEKKDSLDLIFLGSSQVIYGIQPMQLWEDYGIASYNLATSATTIPTSYWIANIAIEKQHPQYIVLDLGFINSDEKIINYELPRLHAVIDNFPDSRYRNPAIKDLVKQEDRIQFYFPTYIFHTRWKELTKQDFLPLSDGGTKGAKLADGVINYEGSIEISNEKYDIDEFISMNYLQKLVDLCKDNGIELILMAIPTVHSSGIQGFFNAIEDFSVENNICFINGYKDTNFWGLDYATDFFDMAHVNLRGSEKITKYVGEYLTSHFLIPNHKDEAEYSEWNKIYEEYLKYKQSIHIYPELNTDNSIIFGAEGNAQYYFVNGLQSETSPQDYLWSQGKRSDAFFNLPSNKDVSLKCAIKYVQPLINSNRKVEIYFNDHLITVAEISAAKEKNEIDINISKEYISLSGVQHLCFKYIDAMDNYDIFAALGEKTIAFEKICVLN